MRFLFVAVRYLLKERFLHHETHLFKIITKAMKFFCIPAHTYICTYFFNIFREILNRSHVTPIKTDPTGSGGLQAMPSRESAIVRSPPKGASC